MSVTRLAQEHVQTRGSGINDTLSPLNHDANAVDLADTLDYICSQIADITGEVAWEDAPAMSLATIDGKTFLDEKLALRRVDWLQDVTVPSGQNYKVLSVSGTEIPTTNKAIAATVKGLISAVHGGSFGAAHSLAEVAGGTTLSPDNLLGVWDGSTGDDVLSAGRRVFALLQREAGATDAAPFTDTTPERAQVSFVRPNATYDDLEAVPVSDIGNLSVNLSFVDRTDLDSFQPRDFLRNVVFADAPAASLTVTLDQAIDNQGATPATQSTNIDVRIADSFAWSFQDSTGARDLLQVAPAVAGDAVSITVDALSVVVGASGTIDFDNGMTVDSGGNAINVGVTGNQIDSAALVLAATTTSATIQATTDVLFQTAQETTPIPLDDSTTGPISTLFGQTFGSIAEAIEYAGLQAGNDFAVKLKVLTSNYASGVNIPAATLDLSQYTLDISSNVATLFVFVNGRLCRGAASSGIGDLYPGTTPANGDLKHDFPKILQSGDVLISIGWK
jgi:hypothetical protein